MHRKSIPTKNFIGLKLQMFSPANLSTFTVQHGTTTCTMIHMTTYVSKQFHFSHRTVYSLE